MTAPTTEIEVLREQLDAGERGRDDADRERLLEFSRQMHLDANVGEYRHLKLLRHATRMSEEAGSLAAALADRGVAEEIVEWIQTTYDNEETNRDYRVALRQFGTKVGDSNGEPPASLAWVSGDTSSSYAPLPDPSKMYRWEEHVIPMIEAAQHARDRAVIALQWDAGLRSGELHDPDGETMLRVGRITDSNHGLQVSVDGKQGQRSVTLIPSVPFVQRWLDEHPGTGDPEAPFVSQQRTADPVSYRQFLNIFYDAADRAEAQGELERPSKPSPTRFRKSSASYMASQGVSQAHLEERYGWTQGSDAASRYISVFGDATEREVARAHGLDVSAEEPDPTGPLECPRCGRKTPRERPSCMWCGQALDPETAAAAGQMHDELLAAVAENPELVDDLQELRETLDENPALRDHLLGH